MWDCETAKILKLNFQLLFEHVEPFIEFLKAERRFVVVPDDAKRLAAGS